jgi:hypothetical protein
MTENPVADSRLRRHLREYVGRRSRAMQSTTARVRLKATLFSLRRRQLHRLPWVFGCATVGGRELALDKARRGAAGRRQAGLRVALTGRAIYRHRGHLLLPMDNCWVIAKRLDEESWMIDDRHRDSIVALSADA